MSSFIQGLFNVNCALRLSWLFNHKLENSVQGRDGAIPSIFYLNQLEGVIFMNFNLSINIEVNVLFTLFFFRKFLV